jgi:DUF438 domain-containing protein
MDAQIYTAILENLVEPIVFVDMSHVIRYMNKAAIEKYQKHGGGDLVGKSIFDCHNERSKEMILEIADSFIKGEEERFLTVNKANQKVFMRAVRNDSGDLIGYYERYERN